MNYDKICNFIGINLQEGFFFLTLIRDGMTIVIRHNRLTDEEAD